MRNRVGAGTGLVVATLVSCLVLLPVPIRAEEEPPAQTAQPERGIFTSEQIGGGVAVVVDLLLVRPLSAVATGIGFGLFLPAGLLSLADFPDTTLEAWDIFVVTPARNVYERPLGDL